MKKYLLFLLLWGICLSSYAQVAGGGSKKSSSKTNTNTTTTTTTNTTTPELKAWDWKDYNLKFKAPTNFKVTRSDGEAFIAENGDINLSIYPKKGEKLTRTSMESYLLTWAKDNKVTNYDKANYVENFRGFHCYYVDGKVGDYPTSLMVMVNPNTPEVTIYVWLSYASSEYNTAVEIIKSFQPFE
jgi:hypothetical protein